MLVFIKVIYGLQGVSMTLSSSTTGIIGSTGSSAPYLTWDIFKEPFEILSVREVSNELIDLSTSDKLVIEP